MSTDGEKKGKKRSKAFYRKSTYGGKRPRSGSNVLEPGIKGFLIMCNSNENVAVKESYNILNEYADILYGQEQAADKAHSLSEEDSECEDAEKAMNKEIESIKSTTSTQKRFQNVLTKAKNCVFIRSTVADPIKVVVSIMEDIAQRKLKKARYAARMLPIIATCKAHTSDIEKLAKDVLCPIFSQENTNVPLSYTIMFKIRNNNANTCSKTSVVTALTKVVSEINPSVKFSWSDFDVAVLVEVVCTVCCLGVAPGYIRLRKYNLQELLNGPRVAKDSGDNAVSNNECAMKNEDGGKTDNNPNTIASEETGIQNVSTIASEKLAAQCKDHSAESTPLEAQDSVENMEKNSVVIEDIHRKSQDSVENMEKNSVVIEEMQKCTSKTVSEEHIDSKKEGDTLTSENVPIKCSENEQRSDTSDDIKLDIDADVQANTGD